MRVERHDEFRRRHARPHTQVQCVVTNHPAQEQIQPLATGTCGRPRKEVADAGTLRHAAIGVSQIQRQRARREVVERAFDIVCSGVVAVQEEAFERPGAVDHLPHQPQQRDDVGRARPAMDDAAERRRVAAWIEATNVGGGLRADHGEHALDRLQDARHPAKRQRSGHESHHLAIVVSREAPDDLDGIGG